VLRMGTSRGAYFDCTYIIMSVHLSQVKSLVTTSVATSMVAGAVSWWIPVKIQEALGIVAAYAAVLVVFLGTSA
jgi:hypothetical protein